MGRFCARKRVASDEVRAPRRLPRVKMSPPGDGRGGFCFAESPLPSKPPVHRPAGVQSAAEVKRELDRQRPSAARRGYGPPLAPGPGRVSWRGTRCACRCQAQGALVPATVVDHVVPHRGDQTLFWDEANWAALVQAAAMTPRPRARAAGADDRRVPDPAPGGEVICLRRRPAGTGRAARCVCAAKFRRGVSGR